MSTTANFNNMTVQQLHDELESRGQKVSGNKQELIDRLRENDSSSQRSSGDYSNMTVDQLHDELKSRGQKVSGNKQELVDRLQSTKSSSNTTGANNSNDGSQYDNMTVEELHDELKSRGEKVSGNKQELIDRLRSNDSSSSSERSSSGSRHSESSNQYDNMTVEQLRDELKSRGEKVSGNKQELIDRLQSSDSSSRSSTGRGDHKSGDYSSMTVEQLHDELKSRGEKVSGNKQELIDRLKSTSISNDDRSTGRGDRMSDEYDNMTVEQLHDELKSRGEKVSGNKQELIDRLKSSDSSSEHSSSRSRRSQSGDRSSGDYENMTVEQLHDELKSRGEKVSGNKQELIDRLQSSESSSRSSTGRGDLKSDSYDNMTVEQLHDELKSRGEKVSGNKQELIDRLRSGSKSSSNRSGRADSDEEMADDYDNMTVQELHDELQNRGEKVSGNKQELIDRLKSNDSSSATTGKRSSPDGKHVASGDTPARKETKSE